MSATFGQLSALFIFIIGGFILGKIKHISSEKSNILSVLLVNVCLPCKIFLNFSQNCTLSYLKNNYHTLLISTALLLFLVGVSWLLAKPLTKNPYERKLYRYSFSISNYAYLGYVLVEAVLGSQTLTDMILFCIPFAIYTYTFGYALLTSSEGNFAKKLINPMTVTIVLGMIVGMIGLPMPEIFTTTLTYASGCAGPLSMLLTGIVLASFAPRDILPDGKTVVFCVLRLLVLPATVFLICIGVNMLISLPRAVYPVAVVVACMPCGLNTIVFPNLIGQDCRPGARAVLLSHLLCLATLPLWMWILF
jgi:predicted permease